MKKIVWLASYPRSGNTWIRTILTSLLNDSSNLSINDLEKTPIFSSLGYLEELVGFEAEYLSHQQYYKLLPQIIRHYSEMPTTPNPTFHKVHDARHRGDVNETLFPAEATRLVVYIVRNPLDTLVSLAQFRSETDLDRMIDFFSDEKATIGLSKSHRPNQFPQQLGSWSSHARSWLDGHSDPVLVIRYEDLLKNPLPTIRTLSQRLKLEVSEEKITRAIAQCSFRNLQQQEQRSGFSEKPSGTALFFRRGETGSWRDALNENQMQRVVEYHGPTMHRFGYLDSEQNPVY